MAGGGFCGVGAGVGGVTSWHSGSVSTSSVTGMSRGPVPGGTNCKFLRFLRYRPSAAVLTRGMSVDPVSLPPFLASSIRPPNPALWGLAYPPLGVSIAWYHDACRSIWCRTVRQFLSTSCTCCFWGHRDISLLFKIGSLELISLRMNNWQGLCPAGGLGVFVYSTSARNGSFCFGMSFELRILPGHWLAESEG